MRDKRDYTAQENPGHTTFIDIEDLVPRPVRPDEVPELRAIFWRQAHLGHRLPAEPGIILIEEEQT